MSIASELRPPLSEAPAALPRLLSDIGRGGGPLPLAQHRRRHPAPPLPGRPRPDLMDAVESSGLRGRGGAAFPTGLKLRAVSRGRRPIVVVNGSEGEPLSYKDKLLLGRAPHLVLDGALLAAAAVGAREVIVCVDRRASGTIRALQGAVAERQAAEPMAPLRVVGVPGRYVAGEETALVHWLNGGPAKPTRTPPRPFEAGVEGRPTLVDNVETLAHLAQVVRWGPAWFAQLGTPQESGSMLVTLSGAVGSAGVYEVPVGSGVADVVRLAGGEPSRMPAVLVGGYFGSWLSRDQALRARLCNEDLRPLGAGLGCGALAVLPQGVCGLGETARILGWLAGETAGQCGVCVHGLAAIADATGQLWSGRGDRHTVERLHRWAGQVEGRGGCRFPDGAVRFLRSALHVFGEDAARHLRGVRCATAPPAFPVPDRRGEAWR